MAEYFDTFLVPPVGSSHLSALDEQEHGSNADWRAEALGRSPWVEDPWAGEDRLLTFKSVVLPHAELLGFVLQGPKKSCDWILLHKRDHILRFSA